MTYPLRQEYLISYDVENNKIRTGIFKELEKHGLKSVQKSVFWGYLTSAEMEAIKRYLNAELGVQTRFLSHIPILTAEGKVIFSDTASRTSKTGKKPVLSSVPVNLIRQWCYCPRVVYYMELTDITVHRPIWVRQGEDFHRLEEKLWQRRNLSRFNLASGKTYHNLVMQDDKLGLHGIVDMAVETDDSIYAVEFKLSANNKKRGDILQLVAYTMLLEHHFSKASRAGFLVGKGKVLHTIDINSEKRQAVITMADQIRQMLQRGLKPESSATVVQCCACEYVNHCNDRL